MRTLVDIQDDQIEALAAIGAAQKASRAELIRQAIAQYIHANKPAQAEAFGLWKSAGVAQDGLAFQNRLRSEW